MKRLVIGILAHVDSGKTTLSEGILYRAGEIRKLGRVDHGDAFLDTHQIERDRGITIFSKQAVLKLGDAELVLLDTPGHVDFSAETERTMSVLDYAILVISGTDGVQNHTETLWKLLERYSVPTFLFINKMDISKRERGDIMDELKSSLDDRCIDFTDEGSGEFMENLAMCSENMMNSFLEKGTVDASDITESVCERNVFPCMFGAALKLEGIDEFLACVEKYTKDKEFGKKFGAKIFKISEDEQGRRLTHMKITGGSLKVKDLITDSKGAEWSEKINQIRVYSGAKYTSVNEAFPGMICAVTGLTHTYAGEGIGAEADADVPVLEPVLSYAVELPEGEDIHSALLKLRKIEEEEPELHVLWNGKEIHIQLMGEVQLDVFKRIISERFGMDVEFGQGSIAYRETIAETVEGVGHYEPLRHYAEVHLIMEPLERGSGLIFDTDCSEDELDRNWQRLILTHLEEKKHIGVLTGSPITDMKITLAAGRAHQKHTEGGDFRQATYRAVRQGLKSAKSVLLEPWYKFYMEMPTEYVGRAMTDIQKMGGNFSPPEQHGEISLISGSAPVSKMRGYHSEIVEYTRGKGRLSCVVSGYEECLEAERVIEEIGYDSDADTENTADSVFCSHGAGYLVKWNEVPAHMHLESALRPETEEDEEPEILRQQAREYLDRIAEDKELIRIFESTYGKIQGREHTALKTQKAPPKKKYPKARPLPKGPEYLLVDGYNIIFAWQELNNLSKKDLEAARMRLADILCNYQGFKQCEVILVFDAYKVKGEKREIEKYHNVNIVYTKEAETADMYIEKVTRELGKKHRVRVATSDNLEQIIILGSGAFRMSADELLSEIKQAEEAIREFIKN